MHEQDDIIYNEVLRSLSSTSASDSQNIIVVGTHNALFGNLEKAKALLPVYREFVTRHHLLAWQEVDQPFLATVAASAGEDYTYYCTEPNSRGQAIGFTVHDRLKVLDSKIYSQMQNVNNLPNLRPALCLNLLDTISGLKITAISVHYKSSYGGTISTGPVRRYQAQLQVDAMQDSDEFLVSLGDYNQYLEFAGDVEPLLSAGYRMVPRFDRARTHANGGRMDGMFVKHMPPHVKITGYRVRNFWRNNKIVFAISDHALLSWKIVIGDYLNSSNLPFITSSIL